MEKASIISIGDEIIYGQTPDTNSAYLSRKLFSIGMPVVSIYAVGDDANAIVRKLKLAGEEADVVLLTGGLGPTDDDLTRQAMAKFLGVELQFEDDLLQKIEDFFARRDKQMPDINKRQAYIPAGTEAIANNSGTAPGIKAGIKGKLFIAMPGVPAEMKQMFEGPVLAELKKIAGKQAIVVRKLKCFGTGESNIAESVERASSPLKHTARMAVPLMERGRNPLINCTVECGIITLYIIATAKDKNKAEQMADKDEKLLTSLLGELIFGRAEQTLAEVVGEKLAQQKKTVAIAESCTGGCLAGLLTDVPGSSRYFTHGWVTYSDAAKTSELGVKAELIKRYGAVSEQTAEAMAKGARKKTGADFAISITGIAGPAGGSEQKPVGTVYIAIDSDNNCESKRFIMTGDRETIRLRAAQTALNMLRLKLQT